MLPVTFMSSNPLPSRVTTDAPISARAAVPLPPDRLMPPSTTAVSAPSSMPSPVRLEELSSRDA